MKKRVLSLIAVFVLVLSVAVGAQALDKDGAGNAFGGEMSIAGEKVERDLLWAGQDLSLSDAQIGADAIVAGRSITVNGAQLGGSLRAAGYSMSLNGVQAQNNMTCAAYSIQVDKNSSARGMYLAANDVVFGGECDALAAGGASVTINGRVNGDADVVADKVFVGENAVITGTLRVSAPQAPFIASGASIGKTDFTLTQAVEVEEAVSGAAKLVAALLSRLYWIPATIILALFFCLLANRSLENAKDMAKGRTAALLITGAIAFLTMPMLLILLCITYIGLPLAGLLALLFLLVLLFALPFAGASAARLAFPRMNVFLAAIIGAAVLSALRIVPFIKTIVYFACVIYTLGYFVLRCYENIRSMGKKMPQDSIQPALAQQQMIQEAPLADTRTEEQQLQKGEDE